MSLHATDGSHGHSVASVVDGLETDCELGLSDAEATRRLTVFGPNALVEQHQTTWLTRLSLQFRDPLVVLLLVAIGISLLAWYLEDEPGWPVDAIVISLIVVTNAALGAFQEHRADEAVRALADLTAGTAHVIRSGVAQEIQVSKLVIGDLVVLGEGDMVPADIRVTSSETLRVAEAALTGESVPTTKSPDEVLPAAALGDRSSMAHSGTAVVAGQGRGLVVATGMDTEVGAIASMLAETEQLPTPLEREIRTVSRSLGLLVIVVTIIVSVTIAWTSTISSTRDVLDVLILGVSIAVAAVPEGLPAVLSMVLAVGVGRMARQNALVKRLALAETLGSATVICTDKTGTLTQNKMTVREVVVAGHAVPLHANMPEDETSDRVFTALLAAAVASNITVEPGTDPAASNPSDTSEWQISGDPTETAFMTAAHELGLTIPELVSIHRRDTVPFDAERKRMSVLVDGFCTPGPLAILVKGAPDVVLPLCSHELGAQGPRLLNAAHQKWWTNQIERLSAQAMRTLLVAYRDVPESTDLTQEQECGLVLLGVAGLIDPPRPEAATSIELAHRAGIQVMMLTGDHPATGTAIANDLGIVVDDVPALVGADIDAMPDEELVTALSTHLVYARVTPAHKLRMVRALQTSGHVVAMTGDGVNDAPALKAADIGTAMGQTGTDVAREAADMVLTDDNFGTIIEAIRGGRTIFHNVKSFLRYLLSSNMGEVLTILFGVLLADIIGASGDGTEIIAPLTAAQILWINLLTDTGPAFALGLDPADPGLMHRPPRRVGSRVIDAAMKRGILIVGLAMAAATLLMFDMKRPGGLIDGSSDLTEARTMAFTVLVLAQLVNCFSARSDSVSVIRAKRNPLLWLAVAISLVLQIGVVHLPVLQRGFSTSALSLGDWGLAALAASSVLVVSEVRKCVERRFMHSSLSNGVANP